MAEVLHHDNHGHDGHHNTMILITVFGFWTYLMSDLILFGSLFIAFAVLSSHVPPGTKCKRYLVNL
jgi:cytochrome o ubiquinol oxidase subunit 3